LFSAAKAVPPVTAPSTPPRPAWYKSVVPLGIKATCSQAADRIKNANMPASLSRGIRRSSLVNLSTPQYTNATGVKYAAQPNTTYIQLNIPTGKSPPAPKPPSNRKNATTIMMIAPANGQKTESFGAAWTFFFARVCFFFLAISVSNYTTYLRCCPLFVSTLKALVEQAVQAQP
jgi:hypothetical protein